MVEFKVTRYTIPIYGNKHLAPYGIVKMIEGDYIRFCRFEMYERFTFNRKAYKIISDGGMYEPKFALKEVE